VVRTGLGRFAECVLALSLLGLVSCSEADSQPGILVTPVASSPAPSRTASPTPSADEQNLREAEAAVSRFWSVIDGLSADPDSDLTELTTVSRGSVAAQWARNINQDRYDRVRSTGNVVVRNATAKPSKQRNVFDVTACIDVSKVNVTDKDGKSVVPADRPDRVGYDYAVEMDRQKWYVVKEKVNGTC
jgi:ribosomal protein L24